MTASEMFELAQEASSARAILHRDGHRSRAYWRQVSIEFSRLQREANGGAPQANAPAPSQASFA